jgi:hypothetical protein
VASGLGAGAGNVTGAVVVLAAAGFVLKGDRWFHGVLLEQRGETTLTSNCFGVTTPMGGKLPAMNLDDPLPRLRALCLAQPGATEKISHGEPTWFAGKKGVFVMYSDHHHDDRVAFHCAAPEGMQETLVQTRPERFFRPPYVGHRGWLGVYLDTPGVDWDEVADFVETAFEIVSRRR